MIHTRLLFFLIELPVYTDFYTQSPPLPLPLILGISCLYLNNNFCFWTFQVNTSSINAQRVIYFSANYPSETARD